MTRRLLRALGPFADASSRPRRHQRLLRGAVALGLAASMAACSTTGGSGGGSAQLPGSGKPGRYKVGSPYEVKGVWYRPAVNYTYDRTGIASWYGDRFHGRRTANGEVFDMNRVSAAHPTLPMPSLVEVTNLENNRRLVVRINDRGPFVKGRIIDLSRRGAEILGYRAKGIARVRVRILSKESRAIAAAYGRGQRPGIAVARAGPTPAIPAAETPPRAFENAPTEVAAPRYPEVRATDLPPPRRVRLAAISRPTAAAPRPVALARPATSYPRPVTLAQPAASYYVQAGAFVERRRALRQRDKLGQLAGFNIVPFHIDGVTYYRVRLGPTRDDVAARKLLAQVQRRGYAAANVVLVR